LRGDIGFLSSATTYDIEAGNPSQKISTAKFHPAAASAISSASHDVRATAVKKLASQNCCTPVTVTGLAIAHPVGRCWKSYQRDDGSVEIPDTGSPIWAAVKELLPSRK